jgi:glycine cleavage system H lipoate-binding protein
MSGYECKRAQAIVGITEHAQKELGDVVFVELPKVGDTFDTNETFANVESVKAVSEVFCPVAGKSSKVNDALSNHRNWSTTIVTATAGSSNSKSPMPQN